MTASGNRPRSAKKAKTSSQAIFYTLDTQIQLFYTCNTRTRAELRYGKPARAARGGACNGGKIILYSNFAQKEGGGGGGRNSEQGVTARQYGSTLLWWTDSYQ